MEISTQLLATKEDCNAVLANALEEKAALEFRKTSLDRHKVISSGSSITIAIDLQTIIAQIGVSETIIASLPDSSAKKKEQTKLLGLQYRRSELTNKQESHGVVAVLETEYDIGCVDQQLGENTAFINAVTTRLSEL